MVAGAFVVGLLAAAALWVLSAAAFGGAVFQRENFRGRRLPTYRADGGEGRGCR